MTATWQNTWKGLKAAGIMLSWYPQQASLHIVKTFQEMKVEAQTGLCCQLLSTSVNWHQREAPLWAELHSQESHSPPERTFWKHQRAEYHRDRKTTAARRVLHFWDRNSCTTASQRVKNGGWASPSFSSWDYEVGLQTCCNRAETGTSRQQSAAQRLY